MNRSSSIAFYMQTLALCDVAFFALRVIFEELSSLSANKPILTTGLCKFLFLMVNAVNYTTGKF
jgi:putative effector of murein hydrolase